MYVITIWKCSLWKIEFSQENLQNLASPVAEISQKDATRIQWEITEEEIQAEELQQISEFVHQGACPEERREGLSQKRG